MKSKGLPDPETKKRDIGDAAIWAAELNVLVTAGLIVLMAWTGMVAWSVAGAELSCLAGLPSLVVFVLGVRAVVAGIRGRSIAVVLKGLFVVAGTFVFGVYAFFVTAMMSIGR